MTEFPESEREEPDTKLNTPSVLREEVVAGVRSLANHKAPGRDVVPRELGCRGRQRDRLANGTLQSGFARKLSTQGMVPRSNLPNAQKGGRHQPGKLQTN